MQAGYFNVAWNIRTVNDKPDGTTWNVGIADPEGALPNDTLIFKKDLSHLYKWSVNSFYIATDGKGYHHIIDPSTNYPASHYRSVTIITRKLQLSLTLLKYNIIYSPSKWKRKALEAYKQATGKKQMQYGLWI